MNRREGRLVLRGGTIVDQEDLRQVLEDIRRDDVRASEIIRRLRTLLEKHEVERKSIDLNESLADMEVILRAEARRRRIDLTICLSARSSRSRT